MRILAIRPRPKGVEVSCLDDSGREWVFWKYGHDPAQPVPDAWWQGLIVQDLARETQEAAQRAQEEALLDQADQTIMDPKFQTWLKKNKTRPDVRDALRPLSKLYRSEVT